MYRCILEKAQSYEREINSLMNCSLLANNNVIQSHYLVYNTHLLFYKLSLRNIRFTIIKNNAHTLSRPYRIKQLFVIAREERTKPFSSI